VGPGDGKSDIRGARREIEDVALGGKTRDQLTPPSPVEAEAHESIEQVVAFRDAIKHRSAAVGSGEARGHGVPSRSPICSPS
jgi:hypothetical protein